jgi:cytochrome c oxidase subunit 4
MSATPAPAPEAGPAIPRILYLRVFAVLAVLTGAEIAVVYVPGIARGLLIGALLLLALAKAALVLLYFMHLRHETRGLRLTVLVPFALPALFAVVLMAEAAWRNSGATP